MGSLNDTVGVRMFMFGVWYDMHSSRTYAREIKHELKVGRKALLVGRDTGTTSEAV
jgi:hypothetical protein